MKKKYFVLLILLLPSLLFGGEYTNTFTVRVEQMGESAKNDPVESFNSAVEYATQRAVSQGQGKLKGYSESQDSVLNEVWIKKESHLQVVDLRVVDYKFKIHRSKKHGRLLITDITADFTLEYLDIPMFVEDYNKTIKGAALRSMAFPGWGQYYNRQYTTGLLFTTSFFAFYSMFAYSLQTQFTTSEIDKATVNYQIPAMILWSFNVSESITSRYLGRQGLESLRRAYRLEDYRPVYEPKTERGFKLDLILVQIPLY